MLPRQPMISTSWTGPTPPRLELPNSIGKNLRQMRALSAMEAVQGDRVLGDGSQIPAISPAPYRRLWRRIVRRSPPLPTGEAFDWRAKGIDDLGRVVSHDPAARPEDGLGVMLLNSNAEAEFFLHQRAGPRPLRGDAGHASWPCVNFPPGALAHRAASPSRGISEARFPPSRRALRYRVDQRQRLRATAQAAGAARRSPCTGIAISTGSAPAGDTRNHFGFPHR